MNEEIPCPVCGGEGFGDGYECGECCGTGWVMADVDHEQDVNAQAPSAPAPAMG